jgi:mannose-6-phosphate isomerase-like protein (cupin superfamily)
MSEADKDRVWHKADLEQRLVRYAGLRPCYNAFIDSRTPGSSEKENFTIIGPGVSENPQQFIHIAEAHGFNIGGARQPPRCVNSQHSHDTAEVFVVHSGHWSFNFGEHGDDARVQAGPGDVVSFPIHCFRGFENIGEDVGFLWSVLGGDVPGRVTWAPGVFDLARDYGLVLLENGNLVDRTRGETVPADAAPMPVTSPAQVAAMRVMSVADRDEVWVGAAALAGRGEVPVIGPDAPLPPADGFTLSCLTLGAGDVSAQTAPDAPEVIFVQGGTLAVITPQATLTLGEGDTMTVPRRLARAYASEAGACVFIVRGAA